MEKGISNEIFFNYFLSQIDFIFFRNPMYISAFTLKNPTEFTSLENSRENGQNYLLNRERKLLFIPKSNL